MIYCVVPAPLADELYPRLSQYYEADPNVQVIIDRRESSRRSGADRRNDHRPPASNGDGLPADGRREVRDRRRPRVAGHFPRVAP